MKKILFIAFIAFAGMSCVDGWLDTTTPSSLPADVIFSDPILANSANMGIYDEINNNSFNGRLWPFHGVNNDTEINISMASASTNNDNQRAYSVYKYAETDNYFGDAFSNAMMAVNKANLCIEGLRTYGGVENNKQMAYLLGEALFLRAWIYYELVSMFGNIPARFEPTDNVNLYTGRSDRDVIYKQLLDDLQQAAELMPWPGTSDRTSTVLRPNRAAAKGLRARIALAAGGYAYHLYGEMAVAQLSRDPELTTEKMYTIARDECAEVIAAEGTGFKLESDFEKIFRDNCSVVVTAGGEPLWELPFKFNQRGNWLSACGVYHRGKDGSDEITTDKDPHTTVPMGGTVGVVPTLWYDFAEGDMRRDVSVTPFRWCDGRQDLYRLNTMTPGKLRAEWKSTTLPKFSANANDGITPIILRYADILLMFAEADNFFTDVPSGEAQQALRRVRERGFGGVSQGDYIASVSASKEDFLAAVQNERRYEFVGEMIRKNDLIRWNLLKTNIDKVKKDMLALRTLEGKYADVPAYVFWKYKPGSTTQIVWYGLNRGEIAPGTLGQSVKDKTALNNWKAANGWLNWDRNGAGVPPIDPSLWITSTTESGYLPDAYINGIYYVNPDRKLDMPLPSSIIMNGQGSLDNAYLGYSN